MSDPHFICTGACQVSTGFRKTAAATQEELSQLVSGWARTQILRAMLELCKVCGLVGLIQATGGAPTESFFKLDRPS